MSIRHKCSLGRGRWRKKARRKYKRGGLGRRVRKEKDRNREGRSKEASQRKILFWNVAGLGGKDMDF